MTRAQEKAFRKTRAITERAGRALRVNEEQEFLTLYPESDVSLKFTYNRVSDGRAKEKESREGCGKSKSGGRSEGQS